MKSGSILGNPVLGYMKYPIISHKGAPFFDFSIVYFGLTNLPTPIELCGSEGAHMILSVPHNFVGVGRYFNPKLTSEKSKNGAPLCEIIG